MPNIDIFERRTMLEPVIQNFKARRFLLRTFFLVFRPLIQRKLIWILFAVAVLWLRLLVKVLVQKPLSDAAL